MKLLILGGTRFVGRHIAEAALSRGHSVTVFHRGKTGTELLPTATHVFGDRSSGEDLSRLAAASWDATIDTCGYLPRDVRLSVDALGGHTGRYLFISSVSVYDEFGGERIDETAATRSDGDPNADRMDAQNYGALKVLCEQAVLTGPFERALAIRPGLIVGPHDPTGRFTYWPVRIARGGEVPAPGNPRAAVQFIDARDLATFAVDLLEKDTGGIYNAVGPHEPLDLRSLLERCRAVVGGNATFTWVSDAFLSQRGIEPFGVLPFWTPQRADLSGAQKIDSGKARKAGLRCRDVDETIRDTVAWYAADENAARDANTAIDSAAEARILAAWHTLSKPY